ncbi:MAG TPA: phosphodiester glycosidase family protein, partial [Jiangellaceae bacterium]|nr:phosphodiester glycosidase family protein [Jiangellaceae bacterium]
VLVTLPRMRPTLTALLVTAMAATTVAVLPVEAGPPPPPAVASTPLPLGAAGLAEQRTTEVLQPGVSLTTIVRGAPDGSESWTVEMIVPSVSDPDPDAPPSALRDRESAEALAAALTAAGFAARVEEVVTPALHDVAGGTIGFRVRVGSFATLAEANAERALLLAAGYTGSSLFTGWDGDDPSDTGPWVVQALTVDPQLFRGELGASFGPDLERRETTSSLAQAAGATAAVNAGYFVFNPAAGAPGDPAGVGVYDGALLSETIDGRPALQVRDDARHTAVVRPRWQGELVTEDGTVLPLDGINRVPGLIRNCGGTGDQPTDLPRHDFTCTDADELVAFSPEFGMATPPGEGVEAVLDARDRVTEVRSQRGGVLPEGGSSVQATGALVDDLLAVATVGAKLRVETALLDEAGNSVDTSFRESIVNGGPELVRDGLLHVTAAADGFVHPGSPSFFYGFVHKRNPRTFAGVDAYGRAVLITSDGRDTDTFGLSIAETAAVAQALGLEEALNLDGGGSTTTVVNGQVVNDPSDATGERPVGDVLLVLPDRALGRH